MSTARIPDGTPLGLVQVGATIQRAQSTPGRSDPPVKPTSEVAHQPGQQPAALKWHRVPGTDLTPGCETWQRDVKDGHLTVIVGKEPGVGWHLSISHRSKHRQPRPGRFPKWGEIKDARYQFTPADVTMCMILPPPDEYVNVHETCFHLWEHRE